MVCDMIYYQSNQYILLQPLNFRAEDLITSETITQNFCFRLDALRRRIVILRNDLRAFKLGQKGKLEFGCY